MFYIAFEGDDSAIQWCQFCVSLSEVYLIFCSDSSDNDSPFVAISPRATLL